MPEPIRAGTINCAPIARATEGACGRRPSLMTNGAYVNNHGGSSKERIAEMDGLP
jgi:hypothetical protein